MTDLIRPALDDYFSTLPIDNKLMQRVMQYEKDFVNKNEDHITFFGGHLMGVQVVRFDPRDRHRWFDEVLEVNEESLEEVLTSLTTLDERGKPEPVINQDHIVRSDVMNISCGYLIYRFLNTDRLPADKKLQAARAVLSIMLYKFLTSLLWNYFKYQANPAVAEATYNALSQKFGLKREGNWKKYLDSRATITVSPKGTHWDTLNNMRDDEKFLYFIADTQGRIRGTTISIYAIFDRMNRAGIKIQSTSAVMEYSGEEILKDKTRTFQPEIRYITEVVADRESFVKPELINIIQKSVSSVSPDQLKNTLSWMSDNVNYGKDDIVNQFVLKTVIYSFNYLAQNPKLIKGKRDISGILYRLRGSFTSSRSVDPDLMELRELGEKIASFATGSRNASLLSGIRTAILLYVMGRILSRNYYTQ
jgi:hypothetical protein